MLWVLALISLLANSLLTTTHLQNRQSNSDLQSTRAFLAAEAGVPIAVQKWLTDPGSVRTDGVPSHFVFDQAHLTVRMRSEHGKLDINFCQLETFERVLSSAGASMEQSREWAGQLQAHRITGKPLRHLEALLDTTTISQPVYQRILPWITIWSGRGMPDPAFADEQLRTILGLQSVPGTVSNPGSVLGVESWAQLPDGTRAHVQATIELKIGSANKDLYQVLHWQSGPVSM